MKYRLYRIALWLMPFTLIAGCTTPVIERVPVEVKIPVSTPCRLGDRPAEPQGVRDRIPREEWDALTTDQRNNLLLSGGVGRKAYGDKLAVNTAGCL